MIKWHRRTARSQRLGVTEPREIRVAARLFDGVTGVKIERSRVLSFPAEERMLEILIENCPGIELDEDVLVWYVKEHSIERQRAEYLKQEDAHLTHPRANDLMPFQRVGAGFLAKYRRALLSDDCGLGKTVQAIVSVEEAGEHENVLVVCPKSIRMWWKHEKNEWTAFPDEPVTVFDSRTRDEQLDAFRGGWAIVNYAQLRVEPKYQKIKWDWLILDEAHQKIANRKTQTFKAVAGLDYDGCIVLTATPFGNDPSEMWTLLKMLNPQRYTSFWRFYNLYVDYYEDYFGHRVIIGEKNPKALRREMAPRVIRRSKTKVYNQLPEKQYQLIELEMNDKQAAAYSDMAHKFLMELEGGGEVQAVNAISQFTRLRQIVSTTATLDDGSDHSAKLDFCEDFVRSTSEKIVFFCMFRHTVEALERRFRHMDLPVSSIMGGMDPEDIRMAFIQGRVRVLIATIQSAGTGVNLRPASAGKVVFVDRHFNPTRQKQAEDRVHGIGQTMKVHILNLHCPGTVDDVLQAILDRKISMNEAILAESLLKSMTTYLGR
jgi:SNF2 family DNA or RNA helicase